MKKQDALKKAQGVTSKPAATKDISESSDKYTDEDFESMSKSKGNSSSQIDIALK